jgi:hypothetical protein
MQPVMHQNSVRFDLMQKYCQYIYLSIVTAIDTKDFVTIGDRRYYFIVLKVSFSENYQYDK